MVAFHSLQRNAVPSNLFLLIEARVGAVFEQQQDNPFVTFFCGAAQAVNSLVSGLLVNAAREE